MSGFKITLSVISFAVLALLGSSAWSLLQSHRDCNEATAAYSETVGVGLNDSEKTKAAEQKMMQVCGAVGAQGEAYLKALPSK